MVYFYVLLGSAGLMFLTVVSASSIVLFRMGSFAPSSMAVVLVISERGSKVWSKISYRSAGLGSYFTKVPSAVGRWRCECPSSRSLASRYAGFSSLEPV